MVRKSPKDLYKDDLSRRAKKRRYALKGPFICPKCLIPKSLHCQTKINMSKETYTKESGEETVRWNRETTHLFSCRNRACRFRSLVVSPGYPSIIGEYNTLYDRELPFAAAEEQRGLIQDRSIKLLRLSKCEVNMR